MIITGQTRLGRITRLGAVTPFILILIGCAGAANPNAGGVAGDLARLKPLAEQCDGPINQYQADDLSQSGLGDDALTAERLQVLRDATDRVAACGGYAKAVGFASTAVDTTTLAEAEFATDFGTENARLIQNASRVEAFIEDLEANLPAATEASATTGTDVLAQLVLAEQAQEQRGAGSLEVVIATDGLATTGAFDIDDPGFVNGGAEAAALAVEVPDLTGATVRIVGIGRTAADARQLSSTQVEALTDFYTVVCERTGAEGCSATTDYTEGA